MQTNAFRHVGHLVSHSGDIWRDAKHPLVSVRIIRTAGCQSAACVEQSEATFEQEVAAFEQEVAAFEQKVAAFLRMGRGRCFVFGGGA